MPSNTRYKTTHHDWNLERVEQVESGRKNDGNPAVIMSEIFMKEQSTVVKVAA